MAIVQPIDLTVGIPPVAPTKRRESRSTILSFGKYREIILAVGFFLLFDLGVLVLNFYTSFQIAEDAVGVNLSGRQRMLSQRMAKALLALDANSAKSVSTEKELEELRNAVKLFDATLKGFQLGATVPGGDGKPVFLKPAEGAKALAILRNAQDIWTVYQQKLEPVLNGATSSTDLETAVAYATANNLKLLGLMNELTTALEAVAADRASALRLVQTGGIVLALLNFAFILFKFLRRLRTSDAAIEAANDENREILTSVREGLFLLTPDFRLGSQLSQSAHLLFDRKLQPGEDFFSLLEPLVSEKALSAARDYVQLLFAPHVKESLVQGINPLSEVELVVRNRLGQEVRRYLSFYFNRAHDGAAVRHLLVTVQDISARVELEAKLQGERLRSQKEFAMLLTAINSNPGLLRQFVERAEAHLLEINDILRSTSSAHGEAAILQRLNEACRRVHSIKGDAATLELETIALQAHAFETELQRIRQSGGASGDLGNALLALPMPLEDLLGKVRALKNISGMLRTEPDEEDDGDAVNGALVKLARAAAAESGKRVVPVVRMGRQTDLGEEAENLVREIAVQLVRNAVVHGIEPPETRIAAGKTPEGKIEVELVRGESEWTLLARDDGAGLSTARIRQKLLDLRWYTRSEIEAIDDRQVVANIFKPGFSTADGVTMHAGRGVGLDVVQAHVQRLGGRMNLSTTPGQFTEFRIKFAA